jgi:hypothetical protein
MSLTTVAELRSALGVGTLYADATLQSVCDAADNTLLPFIWANTNNAIGHSNVGTIGTLYFEDVMDDVYYAGQSIVITNGGSKFNGTKTILTVSGREITVTTTHTTDTPYHPYNPYALVSAETYLSPSAVPAIQEASLMVCISIWTSRQTNSGSGMNPDGSIGNMYAMSSQLMSRVRGLLAPYLDPRSMVG